MRTNLIKKTVKTVVPVLSVGNLKLMRYLSQGCWGFVDKLGWLYEERFEKCRESIRYRFDELELDNQYYLASYHPNKEINLATFLKRFNKWFGVQNEFIDRDDHVLLQNGKNYWTSNVFLFEIFTLICRSFHEMRNVNVLSLESWAKNALNCGNYFTEDTIAIIVNHQKIVKSIGMNELNGDIDEYDGFMNYTDEGYFFDRLRDKVSVKKMIESL